MLVLVVGKYIGQGQLWFLNKADAISICPSPYQEGALSIVYDDSDIRFELSLALV